MANRANASAREVDPGGNLPEQVFRGVSWQLSPLGAYILTLSDAGTNLLFPDRVIASGKRRGGNFPAVPQFGDDKRRTSTPQPSHGYGRVELWSPTRVDPHKVVFSHEQTEEGEYQGLCSLVSYELVLGKISTKLEASLILQNESDTVKRIAPAMHPYIDLSGLSPEKLEETQSGLTIAQTVPAKKAVIDVAPGRELMIEVDGFERITWWVEPETGEFVCMEPSLAGTSFSKKSHKPKDSELLGPGESRQYTMSLMWRPTKQRALC